MAIKLASSLVAETTNRVWVSVVPVASAGCVTILKTGVTDKLAELESKGLFHALGLKFPLP